MACAQSRRDAPGEKRLTADDMHGPTFEENLPHILTVTRLTATINERYSFPAS